IQPRRVLRGSTGVSPPRLPTHLSSWIVQFRENVKPRRSSGERSGDRDCCASLLVVRHSYGANRGCGNDHINLLLRNGAAHVKYRGHRGKGEVCVHLTQNRAGKSMICVKPVLPQPHTNLRKKELGESNASLTCFMSW